MGKETTHGNRFLRWYRKGKEKQPRMPQMFADKRELGCPREISLWVGNADKRLIHPVFRK